MRCVNCGADLPPRSRSDRRTCSPRCRVALSRRLAGLRDEPYRLGYSVTRNRWFVYRAGSDDDPVWTGATREAALSQLDRLNAK